MVMQFRTQVLEGTFMRFDCVGCKRPFIVEMDLLYTDFDGRLLIDVFSRARRDEAARCEALVDETYETVFVREPPATVRAVLGEFTRRIVFGYEELREKVVCFSAGLDDRILEAVKLMLKQADRSLVQRLSLQAVDDESLWLARVGVQGPLLRVPKEVYAEAAGDVTRIASLLPGLWTGHYVCVEKCLIA